MMNDISEDTANQLVKAFEVATERMKEFDSQMKQATNAAYKLALAVAASHVAKYLEKVLKSTWVTRWYWKRKYHKAMNVLYSLISSCPPPIHFQCRCESKILIR